MENFIDKKHGTHMLNRFISDYGNNLNKVQPFPPADLNMRIFEGGVTSLGEMFSQESIMIL